MADMVLDGFPRALDGFEAALAGVAQRRGNSPSPCAAWSAADVAGHVIGGLRETEALMAALDPPALARLVPGP